VRPGVLLSGLGIAVVVAVAAGVFAPARHVAAPPHEAAEQKSPSPRPAPQPATPSPSFDVVKVAPDGTAVIAGRAAPGAKVTVLDGTRPLGTVGADSRGEWVLLPKAPLPAGARQLRLEAHNPNGATLQSQQSVALSVGNAQVALAVALPQGAGAAKVLQRPGGPAPGLSLDAVDYGGKGGLSLSGHATPGATVQLYLDDRPLAVAKAAADGSWSATTRLAAGGRELRLDEIGADGRVGRRTAMPLVGALAQHLAQGQDYVVAPGNNLWQIARRTYGSGLRYTIIYSANLQHIRNPDLIYPGQVFRVPRS
jgi:nucleoid-associated protein YgaU